jgi:TolB-like protein/Tfp pilus assembly protein PilF
VLPFATEGESAQIEGLFDEFLTRLGGIQPDRLRVIGRRSVERFREEPKSLREIGERLNAAYIVESSVRQQGTGLRISLRLVEAGSEAVLLSETFEQDGKAADFEEQFVARASAGVLQKLFPNAHPTAQQGGACIDGWEAYRTGRMLANRGTMADLQKSLPLFERAKCGPSRAALAETLIRLGKMGSSKPELWDQARFAAGQALASSSDVASTHVSLGNVAFWRDWDWRKADEEFQTALRLQPSDSHAHHDYAWLLVALGRRQDAVASLRRAIALDPLSAQINMHAGWLLLQAGRFEEAAAQARRTLELEPDSGEARACLSRALLYTGDAKGALDALRPLVPESEMATVASLPASKAIWTLFKGSIRSKGAMDPYQRAWRLAWSGSRSEALDELDEALRSRSLMMPLVAVDPAFAALRNEERFRKVVRDMRL